MKCSKCGNEMLLLFMSYVCETCEALLAQVNPIASLDMEYACDFTTSKGSINSKGSIIKPPPFTPAFSYQQIGGTGFYYDPEYAKKRNVPGSDFQIGPIKDKAAIGIRYVFDKKDIQALLGWINMIPKSFNRNIAGVGFKYDKGILKINERWSFVAQGIDKIFTFFESLVAP